jgi:hypothetical protein
MIRLMVDAWSRSSMVAIWPGDGDQYVYIDWALDSLAIERALVVSADDAATVVDSHSRSTRDQMYGD